MFVHNWDPVLLPLVGPLAVRWYGLAYVAAFGVAFLMLRRWSRKGELPLGEEDVQALILYAVAGVMLGGRIGYILFYDAAHWLQDPALVFRVWQGGMSSHGGMLGVTLAVIGFARTRHVEFLRLTDALSCVAPPGILLGRIANFINGELWGRITTVRWAVVFPQEAGLYPPRDDLPALALQYYEAGILPARHPAQLYAALVEGVLLGGILLALRHTAWGKIRGHLTMAFLVFYALGRITVECFREPEIVYGTWLTQGQLLSLFMLLTAVGLQVYLQRSNHRRKTGSAA